ncbi:YmiA family putative membrane protein [Pantoea sp. Mb-10]|uniref:YmiA family putative membrane protein n=1 Tax=Pantoea eucrina TaxID=472693 RepID=A0ABU5LEC9_9GAMM|nr:MULTISPECIES: YmiA family putative membrane protein [Pantoea]MCE0491524.1 YmiA family putative membrane protein [Pantoea sp. Mb-10]MCE0502338.1 YmiA family putative membrane protein [Pantoea sp. Pb-8]MDZ7278308.1 YmiA family putative membrane protein [Pantoea eucrina]
MNTRLTVQPDFHTKSTKVERPANMRRKAWLTVFAASALFWIVVALMIWRLWS